MVFSSLTFLTLFLPIVLIGLSFLASTSWRFPFLLAASLWFYAWGEPVLVVVMLGSIVLNFASARLIDAAPGSRARTVAFAGAIALNLLLLLGFKYTHFFVESVNAAHALPAGWRAFAARIPLPIGISFMTFHGVSYLVDVYRRTVRAEQHLVRFATYISLFPHLIAGPIVRYAEIEGELSHPRAVDAARIWSGLGTFVAGLAAKVLLANPCGAIADDVFRVPASQLSTGAAWLGAVAYACQIFFDFSGYSTMAIGLGRCCGFTFPENFRQPYTAMSVTEFWRRWHITLSRFFRDYVYIPLGGNRHGVARTAVNLLVVFLLCGLWHGAAWPFVIWGAYHGAFLVLERGLRHFGLEPSGIIGRTYTLAVVLVGWIFFRSDTLAGAVAHLRALAGLTHGTRPALEFASFGGLGVLLVAVVVSVWPESDHATVRWSPRTRTALAVATGLACAWLLVIGTHNPFIYYRF